MKKMKFICSYSTIDKMRKIYTILNAQTIKRKIEKKILKKKQTKEWPNQIINRFVLKFHKPSWFWIRKFSNSNSGWIGFCSIGWEPSF